MIEKLSEKQLSLIDAFSCVEDKDELAKLKSDLRRRIIKHSKEIDEFIRNEALDEQEKHLNITHLLIDISQNKLVGFISLCNDSLRLKIDEVEMLAVHYQTVPAIKIARLAVSNEYFRKGIGKLLINLAAYIGEKLTESTGIAFITLDCYHHRLSYYKQFGFVENLYQPIVLKYDSPISMRISLFDYLEKVDNEM